MTVNAPTRPLALVTGASSGLGQAFAERLARDQHDLIIVARRGDRLEELASQLQDRHRVCVDSFVADLSDSKRIEALEQRISGARTLRLLVNNAGFGGFAPFVETEVSQAERLIALQITAVTRLSRAVLPAMIRQNAGAIINVSSRLALSAAMGSPPMPPRAVYAATKAFINTFSQILQSELEGTRVRVQALCPGLARTEFFEIMGTDPMSLPAAEMMEPADVVQASLASLGLGEAICVPALDEPGLLAEVDRARLKVFEHSNGGVIAERYGTR